MATIQQQFPGGMTGTLRNQLVSHGMADRLPAVLEEAIRVRAEMGYPIMATPFSQLVGIQALLNVVQGERYLTIPDENLMYLAGWYGDPPGEVDPEAWTGRARPSAAARSSTATHRSRRSPRSAPSTARTSPTRSCCCAT